MRIQTDYETDLTLAVFAMPEQARVAVAHLRAAGVFGEAIRWALLAPGSYQCIDPFLSEQFGGVLRGVGFGAAAGAVVGLGMALASGDAAPEVFAGLGVAGVVAGALVGSMVGAEVRARYSDDVAQHIYVSADSSAVLLLAETPNRVTRRARQALRRAGPVGFLDPTVYLIDEDESDPVHQHNDVEAQPFRAYIETRRNGTNT